MPDDDRYSLMELADLAGVTPRTVRYYLGQGLLPSVGRAGPGSRYDAGHLARLRLIRRLQAEHLPLAEIRRRLDALDPAQISDLAESDAPAPPPDSALDYLRTVLGGPATSRPGAVSLARRAMAVPMADATGPASRASFAAGMAAPAAGIAAAPAAPAPTAATPPSPGTGASFERSQWERIVLAPEIELHVRRPLLRAQNKQVDRLVAIARELLEEDRP